MEMGGHLVHGETFSGPIERGTDALQLSGDAGGVPEEDEMMVITMHCQVGGWVCRRYSLVFPFPSLLEELGTAEIVTSLSRLPQLFLDDTLCGDTCGRNEFGSS